MTTNAVNKEAAPIRLEDLFGHDDILSVEERVKRLTDEGIKVESCDMSTVKIAFSLENGLINRSLSDGIEYIAEIRDHLKLLTLNMEILQTRKPALYRYTRKVYNPLYQTP